MLNVDFEVLTVLVMNSSVLLNMTLRSPLIIDRISEEYVASIFRVEE
jgi:hypothetical protein